MRSGSVRAEGCLAVFGRRGGFGHLDDPLESRRCDGEVVPGGTAQQHGAIDGRIVGVRNIASREHEDRVGEISDAQGTKHNAPFKHE